VCISVYIVIWCCDAQYNSPTRKRNITHGTPTRSVNTASGPPKINGCNGVATCQSTNSAATADQGRLHMLVYKQTYRRSARNCRVILTQFLGGLNCTTSERMPVKKSLFHVMCVCVCVLSEPLFPYFSFSSSYRVRVIVNKRYLNWFMR